MNNRDLPPFRVIEAALRITTERLAREVVDPQDSAPQWNEFEWAVARAVCAMQGISGLLADRIAWRGPASFHDFLDNQRAHQFRRDQRIGTVLTRLHEVLGGAGIAFVPLKGSALRELQLHAPGDRPQSDIDLLVDPADLAACGALLGKLDYELLYSSRRHDVYQPVQRARQGHFAEHSENPVKIEVHARVTEALPIETVDITASLAPVNRRPGANPYASLASLLRHVSLHAANCMRANAARFIQVYDMALLSRGMAATDWRELMGEGAARTESWWLFAPLALAARYMPGSVPATVLDELRAICPRSLRNRYERVSVYEVSWSNLRIQALPGREWSRTLVDSLRFAGSRIWPDGVSREELAATRVAQPHLMQLRWYGVSHFERILRWIFLRPPRVQTISTISAALEESAS